jgi:hypothetical protein
LVYFEETSDITAAIAREKQIKGWLRRKKVALIESVNPKWQDLSAEWNLDASLRSAWQAIIDFYCCNKVSGCQPERQRRV